MAVNEQLSQLIDRIYQAATDSECVNDLASAVAGAFDSDSCLVYFCRTAPAGTEAMPAIAGILSGTANFDDWARSAYVSHYHNCNEWYRRAWNKGIPAIVLGQELIETKAILRTEWSDYLRATNALHVLGTQFLVAGDLLGLVGIHRPQGRDPFEESDRRKMALLLPHLQRALQIREQLALAEQRSTLTLDVLDRLTVGMILVAADCRILFANQAAERVLRGQQGFSTFGGRLQPLDPDQARAFKLMVSEAARTGAGAGNGSGGVLHLPLDPGLTLPVLVAPVPAETVGVSPALAVAAVIFSESNGATVIAERVLARRYRLTPAEARLLSELVAGQELSDYAETAGIGIGTVKTHLKQLFAKTGCHRQVDLVRRVLSDPLMRLESVS